MSQVCNHKNPLQRDGAGQRSRKLPALDPLSVLLDDRLPDDLVHYAVQLAKELNFFAPDGNMAGNWHKFLQSVEGIPEHKWHSRADHSPHLALFLTFLKLYRHSQNHLNNLPGRHLDFFYKEVLRLQPKAFQPNHVHIIFELNKRIEQARIDKNTRLLAGKDSLGKPLFYTTDDEIILNRAQVAHLRSVFNDQGQLRAALFADTADGWGEAFEESGSKWPAFGKATLPKADTGIALASNVLLLSEGERTVKLMFKLSGSGNPLSQWKEQEFLQHLDITASGEKEWIGPFRTIVKVNDSTPVLRPIQNGFELQFKVVIPAGEKAVMPYNDAVLKDGYNTASPLLKILFKKPARQHLVGLRLDSVKIDVEVKGMKNLALENDFGTLDPAKPFLPFGPQPRFGSNFYVGSTEVFSKKYTNIQLKIKWQDLPAEGFSERYKHYTNSSRYGSFNARATVRGRGEWQPGNEDITLFPSTEDRDKEWTIPADPSKQVFTIGDWVMAQPVAFQQKNYRPVQFAKARPAEQMSAPRSLLLKTPFVFARVAAWVLEKKLLSEALRDGFFRLSLKQDFGHHAYIQDTVAAASNNANRDNTYKEPPAAPYTPLAASISLNYAAETKEEALTSRPLDSEDARAMAENEFMSREVQVFHVEPFGNSEQHGYLKRHLPFVSAPEVTMLPGFPHAGAFYIGLENAAPLSTVNILFQLAEGSADPELPTQQLSWSVLSQNHWRPLTHEHMLADHTNHFLQSGIVRIYLPRETDTDHTLLDKGLVWLRVTVPSHTQAVCQLTGVHTQAVRATWAPEGNDSRHLEVALPPLTIKKMETEIGAVKKIEQPYASFGGRAAESSDSFYIRSSERLRHKKRAVTIWDYEHLVLEQFPEVYKAKCLNHTGPGNEFTPGAVTMVLVPQLRNQNAVDPLRPRFSAAMLRQAEAFLKKHCSGFVSITADNPDYEEVQFSAQVQFKRGFEAGFYIDQLQRDLIQHLTPWAFEAGKDLQFGGAVHLSQVVAFVEQLEYVDYIENFSLHRVLPDGGISENLHEVTASHSKAILVAAKQHNIRSVGI